MTTAPAIPVYRSIAEVPAGFGPSVAAIGNFDGVHCGHRRILAAAVDQARSLGIRSIAVTFDPHPSRLLRPDHPTRLITPMHERVKLLADTGISAVFVLPFDDHLAGLTAERFVRSILVDILAVRSLHEGGNFRFGHHAEAGVEQLRQFGAIHGFSVEVHTPVRTHGIEVSSSAIRAAVAAGNMRRARWMLGRPFSLRSTQARGRGIGTRLLVPTVNLAPYSELLPAFGVYVTRLTIAGRSFQAVTNVGNRPTFGEPSFAVDRRRRPTRDETAPCPVLAPFCWRKGGKAQRST